MKEKPNSLFGGRKESEPKEVERGATEHPEMDATGSPLHPKLQSLMGMLGGNKAEEDEVMPPHKGGFVKMKKKA